MTVNCKQRSRGELRYQLQGITQDVNTAAVNPSDLNLARTELHLDVDILSIFIELTIITL